MTVTASVALSTIVKVTAILCTLVLVVILGKEHISLAISLFIFAVVITMILLYITFLWVIVIEVWRPLLMLEVNRRSRILLLLVINRRAIS